MLFKYGFPDTEDNYIIARKAWLFAWGSNFKKKELRAK